MLEVKTIREWVNAYKAKSDQTNSDIAKQLGMTRRSFEARLAGNCSFSINEAIRLADLLDVSVSELCTSPFELTRN